MENKMNKKPIMKLNIVNFRGIKNAAIEMSGITMVAGKNGSGKTSIIQAIAALHTGAAMPIDGLTQKTVSMLIHNGAGGGEISLETETGSAKITYPDCKLSTTGKPPSLSAHASGAESILDYKTKDRAPIVQEILKTNPTRADLVAELAKIDLTNEKIIESLWSTISANGWDGAHLGATEKGQQYKGQWREITGEQYGSKKAESWTPAAWCAELWNATEADLQNTMKTETEWLDAAKASTAVTAAKIGELRDLIAAGKTAQTDYDTEVEVHRALVTNHTALDVALAAIPPFDDQTHVCPACTAPLSINCGKIIAREKIADEIKAQRKQAVADTRQSIIEIDKQITASKAKISTLAATMALGLRAQNQLDAIAKQPASTDNGSVEDCNARKKRAEDLLSAFQKKQKSDSLHRSIVANTSIVEILSPTGLRATKMAEKIGWFNTFLKNVCDSASWKPVQLGKDLSVTYGDRPYWFLSLSEQYRCRVVIQTVIANSEQAPVLLYDGADMLDKPGRNGLISMALTCGVSAVIGMTLSKREDIPNMSSVGGCAYWIENGVSDRATPAAHVVASAHV
jgi:energy-coupling factor transporter ATP-binding protein EcfA2